MMRDILRTTPSVPTNVHLRFAVTLPVLGICTRFETNSREVFSIVEETFGAWTRLHRDPLADQEPSAHVRVVVHEGSEGTNGHSPIHHTFPDDLRVVARSTASVGISDPDRAEANALVTSELVADRDHFRDEMLLAITLALLSSRDRHFLHAAAVARGRRAVLLAAPSGTGKSTLAYVAHRAGIEVMSEDRVWIQQSPALRVWGWPLRLHLRAEATAHFPELGNSVPRVRGLEERHVVDVLPPDGSVTRFYSDDVVVCLLSRDTGPARLERVTADAVVEALSRDVAPGFDRHASRHGPSMRAIAGAGGWRLRLSNNPHDALPLLQEMLGGGQVA